MALNFPQISADTISGIGDPWVAEMHKQRVQGVLAQHGGNYAKAAMALMAVDPAAAQQLSKMAMHQQSLGQAASHHADDIALRRRGLDIQESAEDKPIVQEDEDTGYHYVERPASGQRRWLSGPRAGQVEQFTPLPRTSGSGGQRTPAIDSGPYRDPTGAVVPPSGSVYTVPGSNQPPPAQPVIRPSNPPAPVPSGPQIPEADAQALRQNPQYAPDFDRRFGVGSAQRVLGTGKRTDAGGADGQFPGGVQRVAGEIPPEVAGAFAETNNQGQQGIANPSAQPLTAEYGAPSPKDTREAGKTFSKELAQETAKQHVKNREKAVALKAKLPELDEMEEAFGQIRGAGMVNRAVQNPVVSSGLSYAKGIYNLFAGEGGPDQHPKLQAIDAMDTYNRNLRNLQLMAQESLRGLGPMSDKDAKVVLESLPSLNSNDPAKVAAALNRVRTVVNNAIRRGGIEP